MKIKILFIGLICLLQLSCFLFSYNNEVEGIVTDASNGLPISNVEVKLWGENRSSIFPDMVSFPTLATTTTDNNGYYYLSCEKDSDLGGILKISFKKSGYEGII